METLSILIMASGILSLFCLVVLHFVSPQYQASWRMVSEYAYGKHKWILTAFFILWGLGAILTSALLWNTVSSNWALLGLVLIFVSGVGAIMGGLFDVQHKLHGLSFLLGVPSLPIGALLVAYHLIKLEKWTTYKSSILWSTHSIWISLLLMAFSMMAMFSSFKKAGITWDKDATPPDHLPDGVVAYGGYANRLLVVCYIGWLILIAKIYSSLAI